MLLINAHSTFIHDLQKQRESKNPPLRFSDIFPQRLGICSPNFTCLLYVPIYARLQIFIRLPATLTLLPYVFGFLPDTNRLID